MRKIIHIDMDAYYASIEQRDHVEYQGKPLVVGGSPDGRGIVAAASYEARKFGIRSAMPSRQAQKLCPHLIFVFPRFQIYKQVSQQIHEIFARYTDLIEPLSLDEAFLDVTQDKKQIGSAILIAKSIKLAIKNELNLTASAGVSTNKFIAKIASDMRKPDGITFIPPDKIVEFVENLPVEKFFGVGKVTAQKMKTLGFHFGSDLKRLSEEELVGHFGKSGHFYFRIVRGIDDRPVQPHRVIKSVAAENTFSRDLSQLDEIQEQLKNIAQTLSNRLLQKQLKGRTLTLKVKFHNFQQLTRCISLPNAIGDVDIIYNIALQLYSKVETNGKKIRLLGLSMGNFGEKEVKLNKFTYDRQLYLDFDFPEDPFPVTEID